MQAKSQVITPAFTRRYDEFSPIPTKYKGFLMRSRLEGRWATFLDALNIAWEYELQGYNLPRVGAYLPDFYLPHVDMWAEVKPSDLDESERAKCLALAEFTMRPVLHLVGSPDFRIYIASHFDRWDTEIVRSEIPYLLDVGMYPKHYSEQRRFFSCPRPDMAPEDFSTVYWGAVYRARMARFEDAA